jgi:putative DNA primase/helicase
LAALSPADYDRCRQTEAAALGIRVTTLDDEVERLRPWAGGNDSTMQGCAIDLRDVEPWPEAVDGAEVLDAIAARHRSYIAMPNHAADVCTLWEAHCHCFEAFEITPRLSNTSPEKGCGKTTLLDVIGLFVPRPLRTETLTAAVLFRVIEARKPTVLADEYDSWLKDDEGLRAMFNAGHRRGGQALRCEGDNHEVRAFRVFGPVVLCGIGELPATLHDRSIRIRLERAKPGEIQERFDSRRTEREHELCRKLARWCADNRARLETSDPKMPDRAFNRVADNWRVLFAIAEIAGGDWPNRCADAFAKLTRNDAETDGIRVLLLTDVRQVFTRERMFSKDLIEQLAQMSERPWPDVCRGKPITERWLARNLAAFGIRSKTLRIGEDRARGYERAHFSEAFERYLLSENEEFIRDSVTCEEKDGFAAVTRDSVVTDEKPASTEGMSRCHACTDWLTENEGVKSPDKQAELVIDELGVARL